METFAEKGDSFERIDGRKVDIESTGLYARSGEGKINNEENNHSQNMKEIKLFGNGSRKFGFTKRGSFDFRNRNENGDLESAIRSDKRTIIPVSYVTSENTCQDVTDTNSNTLRFKTTHDNNSKISGNDKRDSYSTCVEATSADERTNDCGIKLQDRGDHFQNSGTDKRDRSSSLNRAGSSSSSDDSTRHVKRDSLLSFQSSSCSYNDVIAIDRKVRFDGGGSSDNGKIYKKTRIVTLENVESEISSKEQDSSDEVVFDKRNGGHSRDGISGDGIIEFDKRDNVISFDRKGNCFDKRGSGVSFDRKLSFDKRDSEVSFDRKLSFDKRDRGVSFDRKMSFDKRDSGVSFDWKLSLDKRDSGVSFDRKMSFDKRDRGVSFDSKLSFDKRDSGVSFEKELNVDKRDSGVGSDRKLSFDKRDRGVSFDRKSSSSSGSSSQGSRDSNASLIHRLPCVDRVLSWRYLTVLLFHLAFVVSILERNCMPIAMVCMADPSPGNAHDRKLMQSVSSNLTTLMVDRKTLNSSFGEATDYEFDWDAELHGLILTAVSFSSFIAPLLVDVIRAYLGNKAALALMTLLASTLTFLTPLSARTSPWLLFALRLVIGMFFGGNVTIMADTFAWWAPLMERQTMTALAFAGVNVGGILTSVLTGYLCLIPVDNGWPFIFYVFGTLGTVWSLLWYTLSSHRPEDHPFITEEEKDYIVNNRISMETLDGKRQTPPYRKMFTSGAVLAFLASVACNSWTTNIYFTYLPSFLVTALGYSVQQSGIIMSVLSAIRFIGHICWTFASNWMLSTASCGPTSARKIAICLGFWLAALAQGCMIILDDRHAWPIVGLLGVIMFNVAVGSCVATVLPLDIAPRYSGFLSGFGHSLGGLVSISGPVIVGTLTPHGTVEEWNVVWVIMTLVFFLSGLVFLLLGKASIRAWGHRPRDSNASLHTVASPLVAMGRRFSAIVNLSPLTPMSFSGVTSSFLTPSSLSGMTPHRRPEISVVSLSPSPTTTTTTTTTADSTDTISR